MGLGGFVSSVLGGGATGGASASSSSTRAVVPEWLLPTIQNLTGRAEALSLEEYDPYTGQRVADFTAPQQQGFQTVQDQVGQYQQPFQQAQNLTSALALRSGQAPTAEGLQAYMNPYQQGVTDIAKREAIVDFDGTMRDIGDRAAQAGSFGGSRQAILERGAYEDIGEQLTDIQTQGLNQNYGQALNQFNVSNQAGLQGAQQLGGISSLGQQMGNIEAQSLLGIGNQQQAQTQAGLDVNYQDYLTEQQHPYEQLQFLSNITTPVLNKLTGSDTSASSTATAPEGSQLGNAVGLATAGKAIFGGQQAPTGQSNTFGGEQIIWKAEGGRIDGLDESLNIPSHGLADIKGAEVIPDSVLKSKTEGGSLQSSPLMQTPSQTSPATSQGGSGGGLSDILGGFTGGGSGGGSAGENLGQTAGTAIGTSIGGPVGGFVGGQLGKIVGGLFAEGGEVDSDQMYLKGGQVSPEFEDTIRRGVEQVLNSNYDNPPLSGQNIRDPNPIRQPKYTPVDTFGMALDTKFSQGQTDIRNLRPQDVMNNTVSPASEFDDYARDAPKYTPDEVKYMKDSNIDAEDMIKSGFGGQGQKASMSTTYPDAIAGMLSNSGVSQSLEEGVRAHLDAYSAGAKLGAVGDVPLNTTTQIPTQKPLEIPNRGLAHVPNRQAQSPTQPTQQADRPITQNKGRTINEPLLRAGLAMLNTSGNFAQQVGAGGTAYLDTEQNKEKSLAEKAQKDFENRIETQKADAYTAQVVQSARSAGIAEQTAMVKLQQMTRGGVPPQLAQTIMLKAVAIVAKENETRIASMAPSLTEAEKTVRLDSIVSEMMRTYTSVSGQTQGTPRATPPPPSTVLPQAPYTGSAKDATDEQMMQRISQR